MSWCALFGSGVWVGGVVRRVGEWRRCLWGVVALVWGEPCGAWGPWRVSVLWWAGGGLRAGGAGLCLRPCLGAALGAVGGADVGLGLGVGEPRLPVFEAVSGVVGSRRGGWAPAWKWWGARAWSLVSWPLPMVWKWALCRSQCSAPRWLLSWVTGIRFPGGSVQISWSSGLVRFGGSSAGSLEALVCGLRPGGSLWFLAATAATLVRPSASRECRMRSPSFRSARWPERGRSGCWVSTYVSSPFSGLLAPSPFASRAAAAVVEGFPVVLQRSAGGREAVRRTVVGRGRGRGRSWSCLVVPCGLTGARNRRHGAGAAVIVRPLRISRPCFLASRVTAVLVRRGGGPERSKVSRPSGTYAGTSVGAPWPRRVGRPERGVQVLAQGRGLWREFDGSSVRAWGGRRTFAGQRAGPAAEAQALGRPGPGRGMCVHRPSRGLAVARCVGRTGSVGGGGGSCTAAAG